MAAEGGGAASKGRAAKAKMEAGEAAAGAKKAIRCEARCLGATCGMLLDVAGWQGMCMCVKVGLGGEHEHEHAAPEQTQVRSK